MSSARPPHGAGSALSGAPLREAAACVERGIERYAEGAYDVAQRELELSTMKCEHDKKMSQDKMDFDHKSKLAADPNYRDVEMMPQVMESMQSMAQGIQQAFQQLAELQTQGLALQQQTIAAIQAPKRVSVGGIQRDADGRPIGATVNSTPVTMQ